MKKLHAQFVTILLLFLSVPTAIFTAQAPRVAVPTAARPTQQQLKSQIKINKELNEYKNSIKSGDFTKQDIILEFQKRIDDLKSYEQNNIKPNAEHPVKLAAYEKFVKELQKSDSRLEISQTPKQASELYLAPEAQTAFQQSARPTAKPTQEISLSLAPAETILPEPKLTPEQQKKQEIDQIKTTYIKKFEKAQSESDRQAILEELKNNLNSDQSSTINKQAYSEILAIAEPEQSAWQALGDIGLEITRPIAENIVPAVKATATAVQDSILSDYIQPTIDTASAITESLIKPAADAGIKILAKGAIATANFIQQRKTLKEVTVKTGSKSVECNDGKITAKIKEDLGVNIQKDKDIRSEKMPQPETSTIADAVEKIIPSNAQQIIKTPQDAKKLLSYIAQNVYWMLGYPGKITVTTEGVINKAVQDMQKPDGLASETDPVKFSKKMKTFLGNLIPKLIKSITNEDPRKIRVIEIPAEQNDLLPASVKVTYNEDNTKIKAVIVTYDNYSYNIDPATCTVVENDQITISSPLYKKSQIKPSLLSKILKPTIKSLSDAVKQDMRYQDTMAKNTVAAWIDYVYPKITDPVSDGQITIELSKPNEQGQRSIVKKNITKKQDDASFKTEILDANNNQTVELTGIIGDRFSANITAKFDRNRKLTAFNMEHALLHTSQGKQSRTLIKPVDQRISYDNDTFTIVTTFPSYELDSIEKIGKHVLDSAVDAGTTAILHGIMESPGLQNARVVDPRIATALNETQDIVTAAAEVRIDTVITTINEKTGQTKTYTIKIMSDNSRTVTRLSYPMEESLALQGPTIEIPYETDVIDVKTIDNLFTQRAQNPKKNYESLAKKGENENVAQSSDSSV
jgi:hypothetical protein